MAYLSILEINFLLQSFLLVMQMSLKYWYATKMLWYVLGLHIFLKKKYFFPFKLNYDKKIETQIVKLERLDKSNKLETKKWIWWCMRLTALILDV